MDRRHFLRASLALPGALAGGCHRPGARPPLIRLTPGMAEGHALRTPQTWPAPQGVTHTGVLILGSGIAGLSAAWSLAQAGERDFLLIDGPEPNGNAASGRWDSPSGPVPHPRGAHYLPLISQESTEVRSLLHALGVIEAKPQDERPHYAERALVHSPEERILLGQEWDEGLLPEGAEHPAFAAFFAQMAVFRDARGSDGRRAFCIPRARASSDARWRQLDQHSFSHWLAQEGHHDPRLLAYLDYICRDEYGAASQTVSAWAGIHYFASRNGQAANASPGSMLTWPEGLDALAQGMRQGIPAPCQQRGWALHIQPQRRGAEVLIHDGSHTRLIRARRVICALPLRVAARLLEHPAEHGLDPACIPAQAPWLVSSFRLEGFPAETLPGPGLAWDNVIHASPGLGWVVATHQWIRQARPAHTVFTAYHALPGDPARQRAWLQQASPADLLDLAGQELFAVYGREALLARCPSIECTLRGHGMPIPTPGSLDHPGLRTAAEADGPIRFAHTDLSAYSVFEEAVWWGVRSLRGL